jgi:hypothetical protein
MSAMNCRNHPTKEGLNTCASCGQWLCEDCSVKANGRFFCKECLQSEYEAEARRTARPFPAARAKEPSWGVLFLFSFLVPGMNYMYLGLIKRGLFVMSSFFLLTYAAAESNSPIFAFAIVVLLITAIFDAFQIRRKIIAGHDVRDGVDDIIGVVKRNKSAFLIGAFFLFAVGALGSVGRFLDYHLRDLFSFGTGFLIIALAAFILLKAFSSSHKRRVDRRGDNEM